MADRSKLDFNFIDLVLSVSGRVRPLDLQQIPESGRATLLQSYFQARSATTPLHFDGDVLVKGPGAGVPEAAPAPEPYAPGENPYEAVGGPAPAAQAPTAPDAAAFPAYAAASASDAPGTPPVPLPTQPLAPSGPDSEQIPDSGPSDFFAIPPGATAAPITSDAAAMPEAVAVPEPSDPVTSVVPESSWFPDPDAPPPAGGVPASGNVSFLFWLLPIFLAFIGGIAAFVLVRTKNPRLARIMLITGIVMTLVLVALGVVAFFALRTGAGPKI